MLLEVQYVFFFWSQFVLVLACVTSAFHVSLSHRLVQIFKVTSYITGPAQNQRYLSVPRIVNRNHMPGANTGLHFCYSADRFAYHQGAALFIAFPLPSTRASPPSQTNAKGSAYLHFFGLLAIKATLVWYRQENSGVLCRSMFQFIIQGKKCTFKHKTQQSHYTARTKRT